MFRSMLRLPMNSMILLCGSLMLFWTGGCGTPTALRQPPPSKITLATAAEKTVRLQVDPDRPRTEVLIGPLQSALKAKGYSVVGASDPAAYQVELSLKVFDLMSDVPKGTGAKDAAAYAVGVPLAALYVTGIGAPVAALLGAPLSPILDRPDPNRWFAAEVEVAVTGPDQVRQSDTIPGHVYDERIDTKNPNYRQELAHRAIDLMVYRLAELFP